MLTIEYINLTVSFFCALHQLTCAVWGGVLFFPDSHDVSMFTCLTLVMTFSSHSCSPSVINTRSLSSPTKFQSICSLYGINPGVPPTPKTEPLFSDHTVCPSAASMYKEQLLKKIPQSWQQYKKMMHRNKE